MRGLSAGSNGTQSGVRSTGFPTSPSIWMTSRANCRAATSMLRGRPGARRGPRRAAGNPVRSRRSGGRHSLHHQQAEDERNRGERVRGYSTTAGGDPNSDLTAVLNLPLIADTLAVRGVIYNDRRAATSTTCRPLSLARRAILASATLSIRRAAGPTPPLARSRLTARSSITMALRQGRSTGDLPRDSRVGSLGYQF